MLQSMKKADTTRLNILRKASELIYAKGYQTTSIDDILATTHVTKGAFYYHFKNKDEMGLAIIDELMKPVLVTGFLEPLRNCTDPLDTIYTMIHSLLMENEFLKVEYGCPASNFAQEMAPWNLEFSKVINEITEQWVQGVIEAIESGKEKGLVKKEVLGRQVALFVVSGYWGIRNIGKLESSKNVYLVYLEELKNYLHTLRII